MKQMTDSYRATRRFMMVTALLTILSSLTALGVSPEKPPSTVETLVSLPLEDLLDLKIYVDVASHFRETDLQAGSTVDLITRKDWEQRGARYLEDAAGHLPSTMFYTSFFGGQQLNIRGFAGRQLRGTSVLLDNVPINSLDNGTPLVEINSQQLNVLDRIEVVRGPGSAVYGGDAFQGVIGLHSYASEKDEVVVDTEAGADDFYRSALRLSQALSDGVRMHLAFGYTHQGNEDALYRYRDPDTGNPGSGNWRNEIQAATGIAKIETDPGEPLSGRIGLFYSENKSVDFPGFGTFNFNGQSLLRDRDHSGGEAQFGMINGAVVQRLPEDIELEINGFYWETRRLRLLQNTHTVLLGIDNDNDRMGANVQLKQSRNAWRTQWLLGAGYDKTEISKHTVTPFANGQERPTTVGSQQGATRESYNALAQLRTSFIDDTLHVLYGGRMDDHSDTGSRFSPRVGLIYNPVPNTALKFLYGNAFRPPTAVQTSGTPVIPGNPDLEPETIDTYEVVVMRETETWKAQVTLFHSDWQDAIITTPEGRENLGENEANGVELSFSVIRGHSRLDFSGSYVESKDSVQNVDYAAFPRFILNPGAGLCIPRYNLEIYLINRIHLDAKEGPTSPADPSPERLKNYWRTDLSITWLHPNRNWELFANLLNIFDRNNSLPSLNNVDGGIGDIAFSPSAGLRARW